jgi:hypothetical protein
MYSQLKIIKVGKYYTLFFLSNETKINGDLKSDEWLDFNDDYKDTM